MIGLGVPARHRDADPAQHRQVVAEHPSRSAPPSSAASARCPMIASTRILPASTCGFATAGVFTITCTSPAITPVHGLAERLVGHVHERSGGRVLQPRKCRGARSCRCPTNPSRARRASIWPAATSSCRELHRQISIDRYAGRDGARTGSRARDRASCRRASCCRARD